MIRFVEPIREMAGTETLDCAELGLSPSSSLTSVLADSDRDLSSKSSSSELERVFFLQGERSVADFESLFIKPFGILTPLH